MQKRTPIIVLITCGFFAVSPAQELSISAAAKTYVAGEQIWVNLSVLNGASIPGAYKIKVRYDENKFGFQSILPAKQGPFSITPAASNGGSVVTIAGFQGILDTGLGTASLVTLVFTPANGSAAVDTASFAIDSKEVYTAQAQAMDLKVTRQTTSVLLPSPSRHQKERIILTNNYIRFPVMKEGMTSVRIIDLNGRICATPLAPGLCKAGYHAVPIGKALGSGIYLVTVRGVGLSATERVEVQR